MSRLIGEAFAEWRECRAAFDEVLHSAYTRAEIATNGALLNDRGRRAEVDAVSLFMGPQVRAHAYASPELLDQTLVIHLARVVRVTAVVAARLPRIGRVGVGETQHVVADVGRDTYARVEPVPSLPTPHRAAHRITAGGGRDRSAAPCAYASPCGHRRPPRPAGTGGSPSRAR